MKKMKPGYSVEPMRVIFNEDPSNHTHSFTINKELRIDPAFPMVVKFTGLKDSNNPRMYGLLWIDPLKAVVSTIDIEHYALPFSLYDENDVHLDSKALTPSSFDDGFVYLYLSNEVTIYMQFDDYIDLTNLKAELLYVPNNGPTPPCYFDIEY